MAISYRNVLIAIDASDEADEVLGAATTLDPRGAARFQVCTVIPPVMGGVSGMDGASFAATWPLREMEESITKDISSHVRERVARFGITPDRVAILYGRPAVEIRAYAAKIGADLIVIGSHGRHGVPGVLLGSTANGVLHGAECDVLTVRVRPAED
jgi:universal stress protein A